MRQALGSKTETAEWSGEWRDKEGVGSDRRTVWRVLGTSEVVKARLVVHQNLESTLL